MDARSSARNFHMSRAPLLLRELLLAMVSENKLGKDSLSKSFGLSKKQIEFINDSTMPTLLSLANNYVKANAITFDIDFKKVANLLSFFLKNEFNDSSLIDFSLESISDQDNPLYLHQQVFRVIRELALFVADSLIIGDNLPQEFINNSGNVSRSLTRLSASCIDQFISKMVTTGCIKIIFNKKLIADRTSIQMRFEHREAIKDLLISKYAPSHLVIFLFSEEDPKSIRLRRFQLGVGQLQGRPRTTTVEGAILFIDLWNQSHGITDLNKFLLAHRELAFDFDILWTLYQKEIQPLNDSLKSELSKNTSFKPSKITQSNMRYIKAN